MSRAARAARAHLQCGERPECVCPLHGPRWYHPASGEHACVDPACVIEQGRLLIGDRGQFERERVGSWNPESFTAYQRWLGSQMFAAAQVVDPRPYFRVTNPR